MFLDHEAPGDTPALFDAEAGKWLSYSELRHRVVARAAELGPAKKLILMFASNTAACFIDLLAALEGKHTLSLLDPTLPESQAGPLLRSYAPDLIIGIDCPALRIATHLAGARDLGGSAGLRTIAVGTSSDGDLHPDLALLLSTSGSTGSPKFVRLSAHNIRSNADAIVQALRIKPADRVLAYLPVHYSFGFSIVSSHLLAGASLVPTSASIASLDAWRLCREQACTALPGVPSHFDILRRLDLDRLNVPALSCLMQAGGRMAPGTVEYFARKMADRGGRLYVMYGQTEASPRMTTLPAERIFEAMDSVGPALPGGRIEIHDHTGRALPLGEIGEVVYFGPNVMMGYALSRQDLSRGSELIDGLHTGDLGFLDQRGYLRLTGRANRYAKVHGLRVSLDEIESLVRRNGPVAAIARDENRILVLVEGAEDSQSAEIQNALANALRLNPSSISVRGIAAMPLKANGKTDYSKLAEIA